MSSPEHAPDHDADTPDPVPPVVGSGPAAGSAHGPGDALADAVDDVVGPEIERVVAESVDHATAPSTTTSPATTPTPTPSGASTGRSTGATTEHPGLGRRNLALLVAPIIALVVASNLGNAFFPGLSTEQPLVLIMLNAANRNLVLAAAQLPFLPYFLVGVVRLLIPDIFFYALGHFYGDRAIVWMERRTPRFGVMMRQLEDLFGRYGHAIVLIFPNNPVCLLAGAAHMRPRVFWFLNIVGTIGRVLLMWWIGDVFQDTIDVVLDFISSYRLPLTAISFSLVAFTFWREARAGTSEIQQLLELDDDLEPDAPSGDADRT